MSIWFTHNPFWDYLEPWYMFAVIERVMQTHKFDLIHNSVWWFRKSFPFCMFKFGVESFVNYLKSIPQTIVLSSSSSSPCELHMLKASKQFVSDLIIWHFWLSWKGWNCVLLDVLWWSLRNEQSNLIDIINKHPSFD